MTPALIEAAAWLQATEPARVLRASVWLYPLVNAGHVVGVALLFGAIVPLDLRLLGAWPQVRTDLLARVLVPVAVAGLLLATLTGALLLATRAEDYAREPWMAAKLAAVLLAAANALALRRTAPGGAWMADPRPPRAAAVAGAASIVLWLAAIVLGRLIGYR